MRILQIHSGYSFNGAIRYAAVVSRLLASRGHEIVILQRPGLDLGSMLPMPGNIEVHTSSLRRVPGEIRRIGEFCRRRGIDAIHTHKSSAQAFVDDSYLNAATDEPMATRRALGIADGRLMLVTIGNVERRKGILDLVEALPRVLQAGLDACLVVAGWFHSTGYRVEVEGR